MLADIIFDFNQLGTYFNLMDEDEEGLSWGYAALSWVSLVAIPFFLAIAFGDALDGSLGPFNNSLISNVCLRFLAFLCFFIFFVFPLPIFPFLFYYAVFPLSSILVQYIPPIKR